MKNKIIFTGLLSLSLAFSGIDYYTQIQPIFSDNCGGCHTAYSQGGLNLSSYDQLMDGGDSGDAVIAGDYQSSILYDRITRDDSESGDMPPSGSLTSSEIDLIAQWINEGALEQSFEDILGCMDPLAYNCSDNDSYIFQVGATDYDNTCDTCSSGVPCDGFYNPEATVDDGSCRYYQAPSDDQVTFSTGEGVISIDWSGFTPPELSIIDSYHVQRCVGEGCTWVEGTWPFNSYQGTSIDDIFGWENEAEEIKYAFAVKYSNNPYWGWAISSINFSSSDSCSAGDVNSDSTINILDVVSIVQYVLANVDYSEDQVCAADINGDSTVNILDIVALVQLILGG